jgi:hypothetical protein
MESNSERSSLKGLLACVFLAVALIFFIALGSVTADPDGASGTIVSNETKNTTAAYEINISGGYIATVNLTATIQNVRWKAFVGNVSGSFTLDDASGSTIYDWSIASVSGEVYATRNSSTIIWSDLECANLTTLEAENTAMNHTSATDNITATFNTTSGATHDLFYVANVSLSANSCPTLNTYQNSGTQDSVFQEVALHEKIRGNIIYAAIMEQGSTGFDGGDYDFQMIVPENGAPTFSGLTAYYLYVELS